MENLYQRQKLKKKPEVPDQNGGPNAPIVKQESAIEHPADEILKFRHGISPVARNIRNIRHREKPSFDVE